MYVHVCNQGDDIDRPFLSSPRNSSVFFFLSSVMELNGSDGGEYVNLRLGGAAAAADRRLSCPGKRSGADAADERGEADQSSVGRSGSLAHSKKAPA